MTFLSVNAADRPAPVQQQQPDPAELVDAPPPPPGKRFQSRRPPPAAAAVPEPDANFNQEEPDTQAAQPPPVRGNVPRQRLQVDEPITRILNPIYLSFSNFEYFWCLKVRFRFFTLIDLKKILLMKVYSSS